MPQGGAILLTPNNDTFGWLLNQVSQDPGLLSGVETLVIDQTILGSAFADKWFVAGAANQLCTASQHDSPCPGRLQRQPEAVRCGDSMRCMWPMPTQWFLVSAHSQPG